MTEQLGNDKLATGGSRAKRSRRPSTQESQAKIGELAVKLFKDLQKIKEEESVVQTYDNVLTIIRDVLRLEGVDKEAGAQFRLEPG